MFAACSPFVPNPVVAARTVTVVGMGGPVHNAPFVSSAFAAELSTANKQLGFDITIL